MNRFIPTTLPQYRLTDHPKDGGFSDPFLYSLAFHGKPLERVVSENQTVEIAGWERGFAPGNEPHPAPGTRVLVVGRFGGSDCGYYCLEVSVYDAYQQQKQDEQAAHQLRIQQARELAENTRKQALREHHLTGQALLARLHLPVRWHVGYKSVVRSLTQNSRGDGRLKTSVHHIVLEEEISAGRLLRRAGQFLCSQSQSKWGGAYTDEREPAYNFEGVQYPPVVDCPACLLLVERKGWLLPGEGEEK